MKIQKVITGNKFTFQHAKCCGLGWDAFGLVMVFQWETCWVSKSGTSGPGKGTLGHCSHLGTLVQCLTATTAPPQVCSKKPSLREVSLLARISEDREERRC